jgi:hypothetical protein
MEVDEDDPWSGILAAVMFATRATYHLHPSEKYRDGFSLTKTIQISFKYI